MSRIWCPVGTLKTPRSFLLLWLVSVAIITSFMVYPAKASDFIGLRFGPNGDKTRIVFDLKGAPVFTISGDDDGNGRLFLDFQDMRTGPEGINGFAGKGHVGRYQYSPNINNRTRFVVDLKRTAKIKDIFVLEPKGGVKKHRLVIDLETASMAGFLNSLAVSSSKTRAFAPAQSAPQNQTLLTNKRPIAPKIAPTTPVTSKNRPEVQDQSRGPRVANRGRADIKEPSLKPIARLSVRPAETLPVGPVSGQKVTPPRTVVDILNAEAASKANNPDVNSLGGPPLNNQRVVGNSFKSANPNSLISNNNTNSVLKAAPAKVTIVIDPGHGGRDPGALGKYNKATKSRTYESHVNLAAAQTLARILRKRGAYNVVLTRNNDTRVDLERRSEVARDVNADLFISLHADGNDNKELRGSSVYTLSEEGSKRSILEAQAQESYKVYNVDIATVSPDLEATLFGVAQSYTQTENSKFANILLANLGKVVPLVKNAQRSDDLKVLLRPDVPAVLLEMAFISNEQDEKNLKSTKWRNRTMGAVADAIDAYFVEKRASEQVIVRETN